VNWWGEGWGEAGYYLCKVGNKKQSLKQRRSSGSQGEFNLLTPDGAGNEVELAAFKTEPRKHERFFFI